MEVKQNINWANKSLNFDDYTLLNSVTVSKLTNII